MQLSLDKHKKSLNLKLKDPKRKNTRRNIRNVRRNIRTAMERNKLTLKKRAETKNGSIEILLNEIERLSSRSFVHFDCEQCRCCCSSCREPRLSDTSCSCCVWCRCSTFSVTRCFGKFQVRKFNGKKKRSEKEFDIIFQRRHRSTSSDAFRLESSRLFRHRNRW